MSTLIAVGTATINAAFMQEIKEVNSEFWALLAEARHACTRASAGSLHCDDFVKVLLELKDQFALYIALEEGYGYLDNPIEVSVHSAHQVEHLRSEHAALYARLDDIVERAETMRIDGEYAVWASGLPDEFLAFHEQLMIHEHRENELLMIMLDQDTGTVG